MINLEIKKQLATAKEVINKLAIEHCREEWGDHNKRVTSIFYEYYNGDILWPELTKLINIFYTNEMSRSTIND